MRNLIILLAFLPTILNAYYSETEIVAATLILEAGGEYHEGSMEAVHEVLVNRANRRNTTPAIEALRKWQFSCWNGRTVESGVLKASKHPRWKEAVRIVLSPKTNYVGKSDHYHTISVDPWWNDDMVFIKQIGNHLFWSSR
jgi:spore germination cell wall hydrolase CwlJ-like protein